MADLAELFLRMVVIGVAVAAPVGAMGMLTIQRTLARGWRAGLATGLGIATADAAFAALAAFGVSAVAEWLMRYEAPLRILGGAGLLWLGWRALRTRAPAPAVPEVPVRTSIARMFGTAVGLTLTNPLTIMAFAAIFAGAGLVAQPGMSSAVVVTLGVAVGSLLWWLALVTGVWAVRHAMSPRLMGIINRISGAILMAFGALAIITGVTAST